MSGDILARIDDTLDDWHGSADSARWAGGPEQSEWDASGECPITGDAVVQREGDETPVWIKTDPEIHVVAELIHDSEMRQLLLTHYVIGEYCPHDSRSIHARLRSRP